MIITIDGPAGAGKSSAARALAARLGFEFLDTGAMYRAVALAGRDAGISLSDEAQLARLLQTIQLSISPSQVILNNDDVTIAIRTAEITRLSRAVADSPVVRRHLGAMQRQMAAGRNIVCEGRDQGTVVFPDAQCKFFLTASAEERARRRHGEMLARGESVPFEEVLRAQEERDRQDANRAVAPMVPAPDAIVVDSTGKALQEVVTILENHVRAKFALR